MAAAHAATLGYIYVGPEKDFGYNTSMDVGRQYVQKNLPGTKTLHVENIPETAEVEKVMVELRPVIEDVLIAMLAEGNVLLEGVPGIGKTYLIKIDEDEYTPNKNTGQ